MGRHATENFRMYQRYFRLNNRKSISLGDKSQYVPCRCYKKLFYPFNVKETYNVKSVYLVGTTNRRRLKLFKPMMVEIYAYKKLMINNIIFDNKNLKVANTFDHPRE